MVTEMGQNKILVIDDELQIRRLIRKGLSRAGYECIEVNDPREVLKRIEVDNPELVILDIKMPGMSGRDLLPEIVNSYPEIGVIMSTAVVDPCTIIECMKLGAQDYIPKPFEVEEIISSVEKVLEMKRLEKKISEYHKQMEHTVDSQKNEIRALFLKSIEALIYALEAKDKYTAGHSRRVARFAVAIGQELGLTQELLEELRWAALLHDVGKIAIDPSIQNKPGRLTDEEYRHMMTHAIVGGGIIKPLASKNIIDIVVHHHDHFDGTSLGQKTRGDSIPLGARVVAVADSFDAMVSDRPYRFALPLEKAVGELKRCSGTQFDTKVVSAFLKLPIAQLIEPYSKESPC
jgi:putative two-component system response regulator